MSHTHVSIQGESFLINDHLTYSEIEKSKPDVHGLTTGPTVPGLPALVTTHTIPHRTRTG